MERWESTCSNIAAPPADSLLPFALHGNSNCYLFLSLPLGININLNPKAWSDVSCYYITSHLTRTPLWRGVFPLENRPTCCACWGNKDPPHAFDQLRNICIRFRKTVLCQTFQWATTRILSSELPGDRGGSNPEKLCQLLTLNTLWQRRPGASGCK